MSQSNNSVFAIYREGSFGFEEISQILEMMPNRASIGGEKGSNTIWKLFVSDNSLNLEDQLRSWVNIFECKADKLLELKKRGWTIDIDCLIQPENGAAITSFDPGLLGQLSNLHVNLIIRIWG